MNARSLAHGVPAAVLLGIVLALPRAGAAADSRLAFEVKEGLNLNSFLRDGPVAAHLVLRAGHDPRILAAFPAGNSGVALWFAHGAREATWKLTRAPRPLAIQDSHGRVLHGLRARISVRGVSELVVKQAVLSSVRVLRDYQALGTFPAELAARPTSQASSLTWARDRLDGAPGYLLRIEVAKGSLRDARFGASGGEMTLDVTAASGETPLTPIPTSELLEASAVEDPAARNALTFLSYREKFLAGSWRFDTYFGRDTLMSMRLLMPALQPSAVEAGLGAVLTRLSSRGEVAHEEDIGEFAILDHQRAGQKATDAPTFDYKMIDSTFMLAPVAAAWLLDDVRGRANAGAFLARDDARYGEAPRRFGADLALNLRYVLHAAAKFADDPRAANLIALKPGIDVGQWRDSDTGLAGGRIPYDVNAVFVPAALDAAARFLAAGLLDAYLPAEDRPLFAKAAAMAEVWHAKAQPFFGVTIPSEAARKSIAAYAGRLGIADAAASQSIGQGPIEFDALSLDGEGRPIPVLHSDSGFDLLFGHPDAAALSREVTAMMRPFPAGLRTPVGILVANPVFASGHLQDTLSSSAYHGTVIWSWQQAVLAAGLSRQRARNDLPLPVQRILRSAQESLWPAIRAGHGMRNSELWSWQVRGGRFEIVPFGQSAADADESNAAQLWSTVYLAIPDPATLIAP